MTQWFRRPGPLVRYSLPFITLFAALCVQFVISLFVSAKADFPYALFYLVGVFVSAWFGGYWPGVISTMSVLIGLPLLAKPDFRLASLDPPRLILLGGLSAIISWVAQSQRKQRVLLQEANTELDERVRIRTQELERAVKALEWEVVLHRRTEEALRNSEERVDLALDSAGIGRWDMDLDTGVIACSACHDQIFGNDAEHASSGLFDRVLPDFAKAVDEKVKTAIASGSVCEFECPIRHPDGTVRWVWLRGRVLRDEFGHPVSILGSSSDITKRIAAEQKVTTQLERMNLLGNITRVIGERQDLPSIFQVVIGSLEEELPIDFGCVCTYDGNLEEFLVTSVGVRTEQVGMELASPAHMHLSVSQNGLEKCARGELIYEPDVTQTHVPLTKVLAKGNLCAMVVAPLRFESRVFGMLLVARTKANSFSSGECEFLRQLAEHMALASQQSETYGALQEAYEDLRQTQQTVLQQERLKALGQMASGIAHDINNAISPVGLYTEMLLEQEKNLSPRTREYLEIAQRAMEDVAHTVSRMREFYRHREEEITLSTVNLNALTRQVIDLTRARWSDIPQQRGVVIEMKRELEENLLSVSGIESEIREALTNLIFNAVDAMPEGGILTVRTKTEKIPGLPDRAVVEVIDTGVGMNEEICRRCLEPFFSTKGERGTGLGLAMVYGVMQRHNGDVEIQSTPSEGTTMKLRFLMPANGSNPDQVLAPEPMPPRMRILSVDDDPLIIKSLRDALEADGHSVVSAQGGQAGIDVFRAAQQTDKQFSVVITDLGMPYVDGRKVASAIKGASPSTPVIMLTGWGQRLITEGEVPPNVDQVLNKPPKLRDLRAALVALSARVRSGEGTRTC